MHIASRYFLIAALAVSGLALRITHKRDIPQVDADIEAIWLQATTLNIDINTFPASDGSRAAVLVRELL